MNGRSEVLNSRYVERSISWSDVTSCNEYDIDERPHTETTEAKELSYSFTPQAEVESIGAEASQSDTEMKSKTIYN